MLPAMNLTKALELVDGDKELLKDVASECLESFPRRMREIENEIETDDREQIMRKVHGLKSNIGLLGAENAFAAANELEIKAAEAGVEEVRNIFRRLQNEMKRVQDFYADPNWSNLC
jgi:HPt (histidine-containing phosphotransfer) domain-containing protein